VGIGKFFRIQPVSSSAESAAAYVPWVMVSRGLAFARTLLVARILGESGKEAFGLYQPALEFVNPLAALILFGAADVAERYVSIVETRQGGTGLRGWLWKRWQRLILIGAVAGLVLLAIGDWVGQSVWGSTQMALLAVCLATVLALAWYQHLAATLRGLRAYGATAGMEILNALLLFGLSIAAATTRRADRLMAAYLVSLLIPLLLYGWLVMRHTRAIEKAAAEAKDPPFASGDILAYAVAPANPKLGRFAAFALVRLLMVMLFGFFSIWGVRLLGQRMTASGILQAGQYAIPYRIAQLLGFAAVTVWASSYGIAARAWSHGRVRRAKAQFFRVGRLGMAGMLLIAVVLLWCRPILAWFLPAYASSINLLLPRMLAMFLAYGLVSFLSAFADLREAPEEGAAMWGIAILIQGVGIVLGLLLGCYSDPMQYMLLITCAGLAGGLLSCGPLILRPLRFAATGIPLVVMMAAACALFAPIGLVDWIAGPVLLATIASLWFSKMLIRPLDRRAFQRWRSTFRARPVPAPQAPADLPTPL
jgi:hypothetical protein